MEKSNIFPDKFGKDGVEERLAELCAKIPRETEIIVIGAASILLNYNIGRQTEDVDIMTKLIIPFAAQYDIQIVNEGILFLLPDYRDRLVEHYTLGKVKVYGLSGIDVALVKLGRGLERDIADIKLLITNNVITLSEFKSYYPKFRAGYGGSYAIVDDNYFCITGDRYEANDRMF